MEALRLVDTRNIERPDWLEVRRMGIGGSDIAAIAGVNPWKNAVAVYMEKLNEIPEQPDNERMYWGRILEDIVAQEFKKRNDLKVQRINAILQHPEFPIFLANVDRKVIDKSNGNAILEIKTTGAWNAKEWEENVPDWVQVQLQWYLGITGFTSGYVAALIGGNKYVQHEIDRDDEIVSYLQQIALDFWKKVESRTPPELDGSQASSEILSLLYPTSAPETVIDLPPDAEELVEEFQAAQVEEKAAKERKEAAANKLKALMGECECGLVGERKVTWKSVSSSRFDSKRFKKDYPDLYKQYAAVSEYRRFTVK